MDRRLTVALVATAGVLVFAFGVGFALPAAASTGVLNLVVGIVSSALVGAGLGTVLHIKSSEVAERRVNALRRGSGRWRR
ncbi:hypothetical protein DFR68_11155 [Nocardia mexicana]|uniref:Uncharacterized protein n=1 Tax=Nocardia mexicana TaxID=279262 RepID=A0A370GRH3_9NOCA|nr:hypothetical protein DFR68_11155 [Nocardia mexicana]